MYPKAKGPNQVVVGSGGLQRSGMEYTMGEVRTAPVSTTPRGQKPSQRHGVGMNAAEP